MADAFMSLDIMSESEMYRIMPITDTEVQLHEPSQGYLPALPLGSDVLSAESMVEGNEGLRGGEQAATPLKQGKVKSPDGATLNASAAMMAPKIPNEKDEGKWSVGNDECVGRVLQNAPKEHAKRHSEDLSARPLQKPVDRRASNGEGASREKSDDGCEAPDVSVICPPNSRESMAAATSFRDTASVLSAAGAVADKAGAVADKAGAVADKAEAFAAKVEFWDLTIQQMADDVAACIDAWRRGPTIPGALMSIPDTSAVRQLCNAASEASRQLEKPGGDLFCEQYSDASVGLSCIDKKTSGQTTPHSKVMAAPLVTPERPPGHHEAVADVAVLTSQTSSSNKRRYPRASGRRRSSAGGTRTGTPRVIPGQVKRGALRHHELRSDRRASASGKVESAIDRWQRMEDLDPETKSRIECALFGRREQSIKKGSVVDDTNGRDLATRPMPKERAARKKTASADKEARETLEDAVGLKEHGGIRRCGDRAGEGGRVAGLHRAQPDDKKLACATEVTCATRSERAQDVTTSKDAEMVVPAPGRIKAERGKRKKKRKGGAALGTLSDWCTGKKKKKRRSSTDRMGEDARDDPPSKTTETAVASVCADINERDYAAVNDSKPASTPTGQQPQATRTTSAKVATGHVAELLDDGFVGSARFRAKRTTSSTRGNSPCPAHSSHAEG